ncbi:putative sucrose-phosphatase 3a [Porphyridium purpureum]|uniref:Putative sucrose-phosphatase 3a n=1 Tax=Porphyridium purpureum TaxID=35688 RepID=A0A5J4Z7A2_PORPP|nr:putative sucrose-phosphatase 3a [Porphyridium purpureum]|eukprot:POR5214..scf295_1
MTATIEEGEVFALAGASMEEWLGFVGLHAAPWRFVSTPSPFVSAERSPSARAQSTSRRRASKRCGVEIRMSFPNTTTRMLLVADLEGAVLESEDLAKDKQRAEFDKYWTEKQRGPKESGRGNSSVLAYLTNASIREFFAISRRAQLMRPNYLIAEGGTLVYKLFDEQGVEPGFELDQEWQRRAGMNWDIDKIVSFVIPALKEEGVDVTRLPERQNEFRVSYQLPLSKSSSQLISKALATVGFGLAEQGVLTNFQVCERTGLLDIESFGVGRGQALWFLRESLGIQRDCVLAACGSMEHNEILFLGGRSFAVATGNAESALVTEMQLDESPLFYYATKAFCGGILEGLSRFGFREQACSTFR